LVEENCSNNAISSCAFLLYPRAYFEKLTRKFVDLKSHGKNITQDRHNSYNKYVADVEV